MLVRFQPGALGNFIGRQSVSGGDWPANCRLEDLQPACPATSMAWGELRTPRAVQGASIECSAWACLSSVEGVFHYPVSCRQRTEASEHWVQGHPRTNLHLLRQAVVSAQRVLLPGYDEQVQQVQQVQ